MCNLVQPRTFLHLSLHLHYEQQATATNNPLPVSFFLWNLNSFSNLTVLDKKPPANGQNLFIKLPNQLSPSPMHTWDVALHLLADLHNTVQGDTGVNRGYALPPASLFLLPSNPGTRAHFFMSWLKVCHIVIHTLSTVLLKLLSKKWHNMLDVVAGNYADHT